MKFIGALIGAAVLSIASVAQAETCQSMNGTVIANIIPASGGFLASLSGDFNGGAYARVVGDATDLGNGKSHHNLEHFFIRADGSTISTKDDSVWTSTPGDDRVLAENIYHVQSATGTLEGATGDFHSWGALNLKTGQGVLRLSGQVCKR